MAITPADITIRTASIISLSDIEIKALHNARPKLKERILDDLLKKVEDIITNIAQPVINKYDNARQSVETENTRLQQILATELVSVDNVCNTAKSQKIRAIFCRWRLAVEMRKHDRLKNKNNALIQEKERITKLINDNNSLWKYKWYYLTFAGCVLVVGGGILAVAALTAKASTGLAVGLSAKSFVATASAQGGGSLTAYVMPTAAHAVAGVASAVARAAGAASVLAPTAIQLVERQNSHSNRETSTSFKPIDPQKLIDEMIIAQNEAQKELDKYYPIPQGKPLSFKGLSDEDFTPKLNAQCDAVSPSTIMGALYRTSFENPVDRIISRIYSQISEGDINRSDERFQEAIKTLETNAATLANLFKRTKLSTRGKIFLSRALKLHLILDKINEAREKVLEINKLSLKISNLNRRMTNAQIMLSRYRDKTIPDLATKITATQGALNERIQANKEFKTTIAANKLELQNLEACAKETGIAIRS